MLFTYSIPRDIIPFLPALVVGGAALGRVCLSGSRIPLWQRLLHGGVLTVLCLQWVLAARTITTW